MLKLLPIRFGRKNNWWRFLLSMAADFIAEEAGLTFTLMPKPFADRPGSGLHLHLSLTDQSGHAVMTDVSDTHGLSNIGRHCVAGLLAHSPAPEV